jgi:rRNA-processing protein FCF1
MTLDTDIYCIDTNVLIQAWQKYYSPDFCPDYWEVLNLLGQRGKIFIPEAVNDEIIKTEDALSKWLKKSDIPVKKVNELVTKCLKDIYAKDEKHKYLVDNTKARSLADPWVIAHAIQEKAIVVTKEVKVTVISSPRIKIPNVCENMGVHWIDDFELIRRMGMKFSCVMDWDLQ